MGIQKKLEKWGKAYLIYSHKCKYFTRDNPELISYMVEDCSWVSNRNARVVEGHKAAVERSSASHAPAPSPPRYKNAQMSYKEFAKVGDENAASSASVRYKSAEMYKEFAEAGGENAYVHPHHQHYPYPPPRTTHILRMVVGLCCMCRHLKL